MGSNIYDHWPKTRSRLSAFPIPPGATCVIFRKLFQSQGQNTRLEKLFHIIYFCILSCICFWINFCKSIIVLWSISSVGIIFVVQTANAKLFQIYWEAQLSFKMKKFIFFAFIFGIETRNPCPGDKCWIYERSSQRCIYNGLCHR